MVKCNSQYIRLHPNSPHLMHVFLSTKNDILGIPIFSLFYQRNGTLFFAVYYISLQACAGTITYVGVPERCERLRFRSLSFVCICFSSVFLYLFVSIIRHSELKRVSIHAFFLKIIPLGESVVEGLSIIVHAECCTARTVLR